MKCIILVAGYATRMYPLTENLPKSLLPLAGKTILEHILAKVEEVSEIDEIILVSNAKFFQQFSDFISKYRGSKPVSIVNDGTWDNEHRLGAVADLGLAIERRQIDNDVLVLAGDNLFDFSLRDFVAYFHTVNADCITTYIEKNIEALQRTGVVELDLSGRVLSFEEKPKNPKSNNAVPPFYIYTNATIKVVQQFLHSGKNYDAPGQLVSWLVEQQPIYAYNFKGKRYDIGLLANFEEVKQKFKNKMQ